MFRCFSLLSLATLLGVSLATTGNSSSLSASEPGVTLPKEVSLTIGDGETFRKALAANKGNVVLVDYWATWCIPCRRKFPHVVELGKKHAKDGLAIVTVSTDDVARQEAVKSYLVKQEATFTNILSKFGTGTKTAETFDIPGDVPFYQLYDRNGKLRYQFSPDPDGIAKGEDVSKMDARILELLAE